MARDERDEAAWSPERTRARVGAADGDAGVRVSVSRRTSQRQPDAADVASAPPGIRPAHPLPSRRTRTLDYDRYLEPPTAKFRIFSAEQRRQRRRRVIVTLAVIAVLAAILLWAFLGTGADAGTVA